VVSAIRGSGPVAERLRAYVRDRVHKEGTRYERGAAMALAQHLGKPPSWVSTYVDADPRANADIDTALAICGFFGIDLRSFLVDVPQAAPAPKPHRLIVRALRLLGTMSEKGLRESCAALVTFARAYPRQPARESAARSARIGAAGGRTAGGRR
jgi:hypothetical protein